MQQLKVPFKSISITLFQSLEGYSHVLKDGPAMPALLTKISMLMYLSIIVLIVSSTILALVISISKISVKLNSPLLLASAVALGSLSILITLAPDSINLFAIA